MELSIGTALAHFEAGLRDLRVALDSYPGLRDRLFEGAQEGSDLLTYKLVPHLAGEGCLVTAVTGGTNTGKSTAFNLLVERNASPMVNTAAATCHPVLAANAEREAQCLEGKLVPEFDAQLLTNPEFATDARVPTNALFVVRVDSLPDHLVLMDTPDVDSIEKANWEVADHIRAAGDVLIAVLTAEKYKDERVVQFFREAAAASRIVVPLMNKANPANDFEVARKQIEEFQSDVGTDAPGFVIPHDFEIGEDVHRPIRSLDGNLTLRPYLENLDVPAIKEQVYRGTVQRFTLFASEFLGKADTIGGELGALVDRYEGYAHSAAQEYDPAPGREVGGLFHEFVQSKRGTVRRAIGNSSAAVARGVSAFGRRLTSAVRKRTTLDTDEVTQTEEKLDRLHQQAIDRTARALATRYVDTTRDLPETTRNLIGDGFDALDIDRAIEAVTRDTLGSKNLSEEFRRHANETLEAWWRDHTGKRRALEALDTILAIMPAAIAAPIALHTGGVGVSEAVVLAGPLTAQFLARVMEYQFGDALFDFLSPWKREQQETFEAALKSHITRPGAGTLYDARAPFEGDLIEGLKRSRDECLKA